MPHVCVRLLRVVDWRLEVRRVQIGSACAALWRQVHQTAPCLGDPAHARFEVSHGELRVSLRLRVEAAMSTTCQLVSAGFSILVVKQRLFGVKKLARAALNFIGLLLIFFKVLKINLAAASQLDVLEDFKVHELELVVGDERGLSQVENGLTRLIYHGFLEPH